MEVLKKTTEGAPVTQKITLPYPKFTQIENVPWKPWVMPGVECKLLAVNNRTGGFTCLLNVPPDDKAPVHHHLGALEIYILRGDMYYDTDDIGVAGSYLYEPAGDIHQPQSKEGTLLFCVFHGPIAGLNDDASIAGMCDNRSMLAWAKEQGVADHVIIA